MTKLNPARLILALATMFTASGCELYFGGHSDSGGRSGGEGWSYCGNDGYYLCKGDDCRWAGARCPNEPNTSCSSNQDCEAGCFCDTQSGSCTEAGFCSNDQDCPAGYTCDARQSCVPDQQQPPPPPPPPAKCTTEQDCNSGQVCDPTTNTCTATCTCTTDAEAIAQGYASCNEARGTCESANPVGSCAGELTCTTAPPSCPAGWVPVIRDGCYTGICNPIPTCDLEPACTAIQHEEDCVGDASCLPVYDGLNCTKSDGTACHTGDAGCTCQSFVYDTCRPRT